MGKWKTLLWFLVTIVGLAADRWSKFYIVANIDKGEKIEVIKNFFYITHHTNTGAAWGILGDITLILGVLSIVVSVLLVYFYFKFDVWPIRLSLATIIGGALGNAIGRIFNGGVTDFLDFYIWGYNFPVFNVADMMVTIGTVILGVYILFFYKESLDEENIKIDIKTKSGVDNE